jgi:hypothetical protein
MTHDEFRALAEELGMTPVTASCYEATGPRGCVLLRLGATTVHLSGRSAEGQRWHAWAPDMVSLRRIARLFIEEIR